MLDTPCAIAPSSAPPGQPPSPDQIVRRVVACVAADFGLSVSLLTGAPRGSPRIALARQIAMYLSHIGFGLSFEAIGRLFGRDRTTVAHACRVVEDSRDDVWMDGRLATLERICGTATPEPAASRRAAGARR
ncbi:helix-turn-helix domain-containing protein [Rhodopseudomonas palustris]|uniref:Chromosomal replication initiator, DnaA-like n=1 Tax=Rhodopseudomonas palustris (strain BisB18) TaxID=316056 RepID=Q217V2_RHOPB